MTPGNDAAKDGTQSIERAIAILRVLATRAHFGWRLTELATACDLKKATTHRILARLEKERLVHRRGVGDRYFLGAMLGELSLSLPGYHEFARQSEEFAAELSRAQGLVAIVVLRSGDHFVVIARATPSRLQWELNEIGARRPLISTSGGVAILIRLPRAEQAAIVDTGRTALSLQGRAGLAEHLTMWKRSLPLGYGTNFGDLAPGINAVSLAVDDRAGRPFASLTLAGREPQMTEARCHELVPTLQREVSHFAQIASGLHPDLYACGAAA